MIIEPFFQIYVSSHLLLARRLSSSLTLFVEISVSISDRVTGSLYQVNLIRSDVITCIFSPDQVVTILERPAFSMQEKGA